MFFYDDIYFHFSLTVILVQLFLLFVSFFLTKFVFKADLYDGNFRGYEFDP